MKGLPALCGPLVVFTRTAQAVGHLPRTHCEHRVHSATRQLGKVNQNSWEAEITVQKLDLYREMLYSPCCVLCFRLATVKRELKIKEIQLQDAAKRRFLKLQQDQREMELRRLDDEIERKVCFYLALRSAPLILI